LVVAGQISTIQEQNIIQLGLTANSERLPEPTIKTNQFLITKTRPIREPISSLICKVYPEELTPCR
jgi:hypothetical protein